MNDTAFVPAQPRRILWGRIISLVGAAGLCVSFFLPAYSDGFYSSQGTSFRWDDSPILILRALGPGFLLSLLPFFLPFLAAATLLPILVFRAIPRVDTARQAGVVLAWANCSVCMLGLLADLAWLGLNVPTRRVSNSPIVWALVGGGIVSPVLALIPLVLSRLPRKAAAAQFAFGAFCEMVFVCIIVEAGPVHFGIWVSIVACGLLTLGAAIDWFQSRPARPAASA